MPARLFIEMQTEPQPGDSRNKLLAKWAWKLSSGTGPFAPQPGDSSNTLLKKILSSL